MKPRSTNQISRIPRYVQDENGQLQLLDITEPINLTREEAYKVLTGQDVVEEMEYVKTAYGQKKAREKRKITKEEQEAEEKRRKALIDETLARIHKEDERKAKAEAIRQAITIATFEKERAEEEKRKNEAIERKIAEFISTRQKQGMSYKDIRHIALDGLSKIELLQKHPEHQAYSPMQLEMMTATLEGVVEYSINKENYHSNGEFPLAEEGKTLFKHKGGLI